MNINNTDDNYYQSSQITKILLNSKEFNNYLGEIIELNNDIYYMPFLELKDLDVRMEVLLDSLSLAKKHTEKRIKEKNNQD